MSTFEETVKANQAKIELLVRDAEAKAKEADGPNRTYWIGVSFGLRRALGVIEGRG